MLLPLEFLMADSTWLPSFSFALLLLLLSCFPNSSRFSKVTELQRTSQYSWKPNFFPMFSSFWSNSTLLHSDMANHTSSSRYTWLFFRAFKLLNHAAKRFYSFKIAYHLVKIDDSVYSVHSFGLKPLKALFIRILNVFFVLSPISDPCQHKDEPWAILRTLQPFCMNNVWSGTCRLLKRHWWVGVLFRSFVCNGKKVGTRPGKLWPWR